MPGLQLITFDLDNTLWPVDEVIRRAEETTSAWLQREHPEVAEQLSSDRIRQMRDQLIAQDPDYRHNLTALRRDAMAAGFQTAGYARPEAVKRATDAFHVFHEARNEVVFFPGALDILGVLADSYELGALTNGNADLERIGIDHLFSFHHSAETVGRRKPAPDMFQAALDSTGIAAERALHVGDHPEEDVHAAREHGWHAVWANLLDLHWPEHIPHHPHRIHNLHELSDLIALLEG